MRHPLILFTAVLGLAGTTALAADVRPIVVELFTSQGCSSCPPAETYLNELMRSNEDVLTLAFHVTYWNDLGWEDPFSLEGSTQRQRQYASRLGEGPYTPQIVVDGANSMVGSNRRQVAAAIEQAKRQGITAAPISLARNNRRLSIMIGAGKGQGELLLIGYDREHTTKVGRGENGGRSLTESSAVRSLRSIGQWDGAALVLDEEVPDGENVAVLLQGTDGRIIGAARLQAKFVPQASGSL